MNRVVHFEIYVDNTKRAVKFYKQVFGWEITKWNGATKEVKEYWMVMTAPADSKEPGINGGLLPRPMKIPKEMCGVNSFVCTVAVKDINETIKDIKKAGGRETVAKFALSGMAWQAYYFDTEGNMFGIHEPDKNAK